METPFRDDESKHSALAICSDLLNSVRAIEQSDTASRKYTAKLVEVADRLEHDRVPTLLLARFKANENTESTAKLLEKAKANDELFRQYKQTADAQREALISERAALEKQLKAVRTELTTATTALDDTRTALLERERQLHTTTAALESATADQEQTRTEFAAVAESNAETAYTLEQKRRQLVTVTSHAQTVSDMISEKNQTIAKLTQSIERLSEQQRATNIELNALRSSSQSLTANLTHRTTERDTLIAELADKITKIEVMKYRAVAVASLHACETEFVLRDCAVWLVVAC